MRWGVEDSIALLPRIGVREDGVAFSPDDIAGLTLWLDAALGVTTPGGAVSNWDDQVEIIVDFVQGTGANQPTHAASPDRVIADGSNDRMTSTSVLSALITNTTYTLYLVATPGTISSAGVDSGHMVLDDAGGYFGAGFRVNSGADSFYAYNFASGANNASAPCTEGVKAIFRSRHWSGTIGAQVNNATEITAASGNTAVMTNTLKMFQSWAGAGTYYAGSVNEILVYNVNTSAQDAQIKAYLAAKHGITL